jgi:hypothetical protein
MSHCLGDMCYNMGGRCACDCESCSDVKMSQTTEERLDAMNKSAAAAEAANKKMLMECANNCALVQKEREGRDADKSAIQEILAGLVDAAADLRRHDSAVAGAAAVACDRLIEKHYTRRDVDAEDRHSALITAVAAKPGHFIKQIQQVLDALNQAAKPMADDWKRRYTFLVTQTSLTIGELVDENATLLERLKQAEDRLRNYHSDDPETNEDTREEIGGDANEPSMESLRRWVKKSREEAPARGGIFDTGFRCVSEGGEVFYFDPEEVSDYMDAADALRSENSRLEKLVKEQLAGWGTSDNKVEQLRKVMDEVVELEAHGCMTGDCPHETNRQCTEELVMVLLEMIAKARTALVATK